MSNWCQQEEGLKARKQRMYRRRRSWLAASFLVYLYLTPCHEQSVGAWVSSAACFWPRSQMFMPSTKGRKQGRIVRSSAGRDDREPSATSAEVAELNERLEAMMKRRAAENAAMLEKKQREGGRKQGLAAVDGRFRKRFNSIQQARKSKQKRKPSSLRHDPSV
jgi:hypothetical protein